MKSIARKLWYGNRGKIVLELHGGAGFPTEAEGVSRAGPHGGDGRRKARSGVRHGPGMVEKAPRGRGGVP